MDCPILLKFDKLVHYMGLVIKAKNDWRARRLKRQCISNCHPFLVKFILLFVFVVRIPTKYANDECVCGLGMGRYKHTGRRVGVGCVVWLDWENRTHNNRRETTEIFRFQVVSDLRGFGFRFIAHHNSELSTSVGEPPCAELAIQDIRPIPAGHTGQGYKSRRPSRCVND